MIKVNSLTIKARNKVLISDLNVEFSTGEFWAILGKNGTGKSTFLNTLAGFEKFQNGQITINSKPLSSLKHLLKAQKISFLPQNLESSLDCTVEQNIAYARYPWHKNKFESQFENKIIDNAIEVMGLQELRKNNILQISGGELRKVEIATILAQDSEILMLDEPLNHLDLAFRVQLMQHLKQLSQNKIIIMITHDIQYVLDYCTNVMMILNNKQTLIGKTNNILNSENLNRMLQTSLPKSMIKNL